MGKRILCAALALLLCLGVLSACGSGSDADGQTPGGDGGRNGPADATIMVYVVGSNLESEDGAASKDILEMVNSGCDFDRKNLLVMTGGARSWNRSTGISADKLEIYQLSKRGLNRVSSSPAASMGSPGTLADFLQFCYTNYPAQSYGLIFWDHGGGPMCGLGPDEVYGDSLTLPELTQALEASPFGRDNKLSFVGFDACLMASAELAWALRDYAQYMIASEEVIPGSGWDYRFLSQLESGPLDGWQAGNVIVDSYAAFCESQYAGEAYLNRLTMANLDLSRAEELERALDGLFAALSADLQEGKYPQLARIRGSVLPFARYTADSEYDLIDLSDLAEQLKEEHPEEAAALRQAVDNMVCYDWSPLDRAHGMAIYYPFYNKADYLSAWGGLYPGFGLAPEYTAFLSRFGGVLSSGGSGSWQLGGLPPLQREEDTEDYYIQLSEEQAAEYLEGSYYLLRKIGEGRYTLCGARRDLTLDEENRLRAPFSGYSVYVFNNVGESFPALYYDYSETGSHDFHVAAALHNNQLGEGAFRMENVWFLVSLPHPGDSDALGTAIQRRGDFSRLGCGKEEVDLRDYPCVYFPVFETRETRDGEGRLLPVSQWPTQVSDSFAAYDTGKGWRAELRPLGDDGYEYYVQIVARDCCGVDYGSELIPVQLNQQSQQRQEEMFQNRFYPLPARTDPVPSLPPLQSLRYYADSRWYSPVDLEQRLVLDDPSGIKMTLLSGVYRLDATEKPKDLVLIFRVDNNSPYFDMFDLQTDTNLRIPVGDKMVRVYFLPETTGVWQQRGGSYYYTLSIPCDQLPPGTASLYCSFRLWQREWTSQLNLFYETETVEIPLPVQAGAQEPSAVQIEDSPADRG